MFPEFIVPDWPASANVRAIQTTRLGGVSQAPWGSFNLGDHVGDVPESVVSNRALLRNSLPADPFWLRQVHGNLAVDANTSSKLPEADACYSRQSGVVCAVMTADCLPVLVCDAAGTVVAAIHAGWRGLHSGVIEQTVEKLGVSPGDLMAWLGPAIGPAAFEVGEEVRKAFVAADASAEAAFVAHMPGKWLADLYLLARLRLRGLGVTQIYGGTRCTYTEETQFFSYRRDGVTGRMATLIWLDKKASGV